MIRWQFVLFAGIPVAACNWGGVDCTLEARQGIAVEVSDSVTGAVITRGYTVIVTEGAYRDSVSFPLEGPLPYPDFAVERAGTYRVTVRSSGYKEWTRAGVHVTADECHVRTVILAVRLQPQ